MGGHTALAVLGKTTNSFSCVSLIFQDSQVTGLSDIIIINDSGTFLPAPFTALSYSEYTTHAYLCLPAFL